MKIHSLLVVLLFFCRFTFASPDDGMPFGQIGDQEIGDLFAFASSKGIDLKAEIEKAYKNDEKALSRVFRFSLMFKTLDMNARAYGQIIYSSMLNLGESTGLEKYANAIDNESSDVKQRIRDILFFPVYQYPKEQQKDVLKEPSKLEPKLFPTGYRPGLNDPVFKNQT